MNQSTVVLFCLGLCCCLMLQGMDEYKDNSEAQERAEQVQQAIETAIPLYYAAKFHKDSFAQSEILKKFNIAAQIQIILGAVDLEAHRCTPATCYRPVYVASTKRKYPCTQNFLEYVCGGTQGQSYSDVQYEQERTENENFAKLFNNFKPKPRW